MAENDKKTDSVKQTDKNQKEQGPVTNSATDNHPAGSASVLERGVPNRASNENKGTPTMAKPVSKVSDSVEQDKDVTKVINMPYVKPDPLAEARAKARAQNVTDNLPGASKKSTKKEESTELPPLAVAQLVRFIDGLEPGYRAQMQAVYEAQGITTQDLADARELLKHPELFEGDYVPTNLQSLGLPPGAQKQREFDVAPGMPTLVDTRYWPERYATNPDDELFEDGDLVYHVHEDASFIVLSVAQQTSEYQSNHHMAAMNVIRRVGGREFSEAPKAVLKGGMQVQREEATA